MVFRTLVRLVGREHLEDLAQDVFLRLFRALPGFRGEAQISTYLYRIAVHVAQDEWKRRQHERRHISISAEEEDWEARLEHPSRNPAEDLEDHEFAALVEQRLQQLSPVERSVIVLFHQEDLSYEQIAEALSLPINTVRTHLHRARKKLRASLQPGARDNRDAIASQEKTR